MMPDYVICLECKSPVYIFEWKDGVLTEAHCALCGNDDVAQFITESDYEEMSMDNRYWPDS